MKTMKKPLNLGTKSPNASRTNPTFMRKSGLLMLLVFLTGILGAFGQETGVTTTLPSEQLIPNQGFTLGGLARGALGMAVLVLISYLCSANKKAIKWKTVGIGLGIQLLIAIGVLKIPFVKIVFESIGKVFISILDFTRSGSKFLFPE